MSRRLKELIVTELAERYTGVDSCLVVGCHGLTAQESNSLRGALAEQRFRLEVVKNSMATHAFSRIGLKELEGLVVGPSAIITGDGEIPALCKTVTAWAKENKQIDVRGGLMAGVPFDAEQVVVLAAIPPLEVLYAQILAGIRGPILQLAWAVQSIGRSLACALEGVRAKLEEAGDDAAAPEPSDESPSE